MPGKKCKICVCQWTAQVNDMLGKSVPYSVIEAFLKDKGFLVSAMSISRHKNRCLANAKVNVRRVTHREAAKQTPNNKDGTKRGKTKRVETLIQGPQKGWNENPTNVRGQVCKDEFENRQRVWEAEIERMKEDFDILTEFVYLISVAKDRVDRGVQEERRSSLVLATTGAAIKDYGVLLDKFNTITAGMDSIARLKYIQLIQMFNALFCNSKLSDRSRFELMSLLDDPDTKKELEDQITKMQEVAPNTEPDAQSAQK